LESRRGEPISAFFPGTQHVRYAGGLPGEQTPGGWVLTATDYDHWVDSPFILSPTLQDRTYYVHDIPFTLWVEGSLLPDWEQLLPEFQSFTQAQMDLFGEFPEPNFHFLLWVVDFPYFHGVEHRNSTMMILGPSQQDPVEFRRELLGLASHELFHAWNICKIRPIELSPYDYSQENYFNTCFIAEGITTYYGDEMLRRSHVFSQAEYVKELETLCRQHFERAEPAELSLLESSLDLWMDGYRAGVPHRKVSVYHKGALVAFILDQWIRLQSQQEASLDTVMRAMWDQYGKIPQGYTYLDFQRLIAQFLPEAEVQSYFLRFIEGTESLWEPIQELLHQRGFPRLVRKAGGQVCFEMN
jgi:predicted metalloprotease with PDZ domain